jgi:hypothetical protein
LILIVIVLGEDTPTDRRAPLKIAIEIIGWAAAAMMLSAYFLLTSGRLGSSSGVYQWMNVLSGAGFIINSGWNGAYPSAFLNVIWVTIALYGVLRGVRARPDTAT